MQESIDYLVRELSKMRRKTPSEGCSIEDAYYVCIQERYNKAAERKQKLHEKYIALCNLTHREINCVEDDTVAMGLRRAWEKGCKLYVAIEGGSYADLVAGN